MFILIYNALVTLKHTHAINHRHNLKIATSLRNTLTGGVYERSSYNKRRANRSATIFALFVKYLGAQLPLPFFRNGRNYADYVNKLADFRYSSKSCLLREICDFHNPA